MGLKSSWFDFMGKIGLYIVFDYFGFGSLGKIGLFLVQSLCDFFGFELVGLFIVFDLLGKIGLFIGFMFIVLTSLFPSHQFAIRYFEGKKKKTKGGVTSFLVIVLGLKNWHILVNQVKSIP